MSQGHTGGRRAPCPLDSAALRAPGPLSRGPAFSSIVKGPPASPARPRRPHLPCRGGRGPPAPRRSPQRGPLAPSLLPGQPGHAPGFGVHPRQEGSGPLAPHSWVAFPQSSPSGACCTLVLPFSTSGIFPREGARPAGWGVLWAHPRGAVPGSGGLRGAPGPPRGPGHICSACGDPLPGLLPALSSSCPSDVAVAGRGPPPRGDAVPAEPRGGEGREAEGTFSCPPCPSCPSPAFPGWHRCPPRMAPAAGGAPRRRQDPPPAAAPAVPAGGWDRSRGDRPGFLLCPRLPEQVPLLTCFYCSSVVSGPKLGRMCNFLAVLATIF